jgi:hypothetical protein
MCQKLGRARKSQIARGSMRLVESSRVVKGEEGVRELPATLMMRWTRSKFLLSSSRLPFISFDS